MTGLCIVMESLSLAQDKLEAAEQIAVRVGSVEHWAHDYWTASNQTSSLDDWALQTQLDSLGRAPCPWVQIFPSSPSLLARLSLTTSRG